MDNYNICKPTKMKFNLLIMLLSLHLGMLCEVFWACAKCILNKCQYGITKFMDLFYMKPADSLNDLDTVAEKPHFCQEKSTGKFYLKNKRISEK